MLSRLKENIGFYLILAVLAVLGFNISPVALVISVLMLFGYIYKEQYWKAFFLFYFVLVLSDSSFIYTFSDTIKPVFALILPLMGALLSRRYSDMELPTKGFAIYLLIALFQMFSSPDILMSFQKTLSYALIFLGMPLVLYSILQTKGLSFFKDLYGFFVLMLWVGLLLILLYSDLAFRAARFSGLFLNPNGLGLFLIVSFLLFKLVQSKYPGLFTKREGWIVEITMISSLILTQSRNAIAVFVLFYLLQWIFKRSQLLGIFSFFILIIFYSTLITQLPLIISALGLEEYFRLDTLAEGSGRLLAWEFAWQKVQENFFFGKGISYTEQLYLENTYQLSRLGHQGNAHNTYLTIWLDTGLIGLMVFLGAFLFVFLRKAVRSPLALPIMFCLLFSMNFESWLSASLNPFTTIFIFIVSILNIPSRLEEKLKREEYQVEETDLSLQSEANLGLSNEIK